jgi:hypothetical protein
LFVAWANHSSKGARVAFDEVFDVPPGVQGPVAACKAIFRSHVRTCGIDLTQSQQDMQLIEALRFSTLDFLQNCHDIIIRSNQYFGGLLLRNPHFSRVFSDGDVDATERTLGAFST